MAGKTSKPKQTLAEFLEDAEVPAEVRELVADRLLPQTPAPEPVMAEPVEPEPAAPAEEEES
jgi:hypothetical protein